MPFRFVLLLSSLALAGVFTAIGVNLYGQADKYLDIELADNCARLHSVYTIQNEVLASRVQALAYSFADDTETQRLMEEAGEAALLGSPHDDGARTQNVRDKLHARLKQRWETLSTQYGVLHLQYLLPNGDTFLRMDAPNSFENEPLTTRPMLNNVIADQLTRGGFEIGRTYAGMRGISAIFREAPNAQKRFVGIVEIGLDPGKSLNRLGKSFNAGFAQILDSRLVSNIMLEPYQPTLEAQRQSILNANLPEAGEWLEAKLLPMPAPGRKPQSRLLNWKGRPFQVIAFQLDDYQSQQTPPSPPSGTVLIWQDITELIAKRDSLRTTTITQTLTAWLLVQCLLFGLLFMSRREWCRRLKYSTATVENLMQRNTLLLDTVADGICGVDAEGRITFINRSALAMYGYQREEVMGKNPHELFHHHHPNGDDYSPEGCQFMQSLKDGLPRDIEEWLFRRDGSCFLAKVAISPIVEQGQKSGAVVAFHDITEQKNRQEALLQLAITDSLTGASNRRHFLDQLETELARQRRHGGLASILMTDLDFFKRVNDQYGHAAGDAVLSHFVYIVRQTVRRSDVVGRLGGEEFAILLPGDGTGGAFGLAERLRRAFENSPAKIGELSIPCTVSIGISDLRPEDMTADKPLSRADMALYAAKEAGRNCTKLYAEAGG